MDFCFVHFFGRFFRILVGFVCIFDNSFWWVLFETGVSKRSRNFHSMLWIFVLLAWVLDNFFGDFCIKEMKRGS
jgi:hypothetical protein